MNLGLILSLSLIGRRGSNSRIKFSFRRKIRLEQMLAVCSFIFDHPIYVYIYTHKQFYDALDSVSRWRSDLAINPFIDIYFCANDRIRVCLLCSGRKKSLREVSFIIGSLFGQRNKIAIFFFFSRSKFKRRLNLSYFFFQSRSILFREFVGRKSFLVSRNCIVL